MSEAKATLREWPPVDLIAGLSLETIAKPEKELDDKVKSGRSPLSLLLTLSFVVRLSQFLGALCRAVKFDSTPGKFLITLSCLLELPRGTEVLEMTPSGASAWVQTVRIRTRQQDGTSKDYFKKVHRMYCNRKPLS